MGRPWTTPTAAALAALMLAACGNGDPAPGEEFAGTVVLDAPEDVEAIVLDGVRYQTSGGWMWPLP